MDYICVYYKKEIHLSDPIVFIYEDGVKSDKTLHLKCDKPYEVSKAREFQGEYAYGG